MRFDEFSRAAAEACSAAERQSPPAPDGGGNTLLYLQWRGLPSAAEASSETCARTNPNVALGSTPVHELFTHSWALSQAAVAGRPQEVPLRAARCLLRRSLLSSRTTRSQRA